MLKPTDRTRTNARRSRGEPTFAEATMWKLLRDHRMGGLKFRRQMPIARYITDFCCPAAKLIVELDGGVHVLRAESDAARDAWLTKAGFTVLRFSNETLLRTPDQVLEVIRQTAARNV